MSWVAVAVGAVAAVGTATSTYMQSEAASDAADAAAKNSSNYTTRLVAAANEVEDYTADYADALQTMSDNFDPYAMEEAFNSLYEAVIMPMERDFTENTLAGIQSAYSGGIMGSGAGLSGAAAQAESSARRDLLENTAQLKFQERENAIDTNYAEWDRRTAVLDKQLQANLLSPYMRADQAAPEYEAQTNTIAAQLAATNTAASTVSSIGTTALDAYAAYNAAQDDDDD